MENKDNCITCNTSLTYTSVNIYCRPCITLKKEARIDNDEEDKCKCYNCRCYKPHNSFITKTIVQTCLECRSRKTIM